MTTRQRRRARRMYWSRRVVYVRVPWQPWLEGYKTIRVRGPLRGRR